MRGMSTLPAPMDGSPPPLKLYDDAPPPASVRAGAPGAAPWPAHPGAANPMSEAHFDQLSRLSDLARPVERAMRYAHFSGWTTLLAGALSLPLALHRPAMLVFCVVVAGIGTRELTLRRRLARLEVRAPRQLALNQLVLGGALISYALFMLASTPGKGMVESAMATDPVMQSTPELGGMMDELVRMERLATAMLYVGMILLAVIVQGGTALYYTLKTRKLRTLHKQTPDWAVRVYQTLHA